jgi:hypothetical protein
MQGQCITLTPRNLKSSVYMYCAVYVVKKRRGKGRRCMSRERERGMFESVVVVAFQSVFHAELHQNDVFFIFKKLFLRSAHKNEPKHANFFFIFSKTKLNFLKTQVGLRFQMLSKKEEEEKSV